MAQASEEESLIVTYQELCQYLTRNIGKEDRGKILSFFHVEKSFSHCEDVTNDTLFILKLEQLEVISSGNVDRLLECLESLKMNKLAKRVKIYKSNLNTGAHSSVEHETTNNDDMTVCAVHQYPQEIVCATCNEKICYACGFRDHRSEDHVLDFHLSSDTDSKEDYETKESEEFNLCKKHRKKLEITCNTCNEVICYVCAFHIHRDNDHVLDFPDNKRCNEHAKPFTAFCDSCNEIVCNVCVFRRHRSSDHVILKTNEVDKKVEETVKLLLKDVAILDSTLECMQPYLLECTNQTPGLTQDPLDAQFSMWSEQAEEEMSNIKKELALHQQSHNDNKKLILKQIKKVNTDLERLKVHLSGVKNINSKGIQLKKLQQWEKFIKSSKTKLNEEKQALQSQCYLRACFNSMSLDNFGRFARFHGSNVIGAICLRNHLAVVVRDKRHLKGTLTLSCISSKQGKLLWEHSVDEIEQAYPVVIAGSLFVRQLKRRMLVACGRKIYGFTVEQENEDVKIKETETTFVEVPEDNYIISMNTIISKLQDTGLMISINGSTDLFHLNEDLDIIERFDCSGIVHSIACLACVDRDVALVDSVKNEVVLVKTDKVVSLYGKLDPPSNLPTSCRPKAIQFDGTFWGVIWESVVSKSEEGPTWHHSVYPNNARKSHLGISDTCSLNTEVVSISYMRNQTLVCLSDGKVKLFGTNEAVPALSELGSIKDRKGLSDLLKLLS